MTLSFDDRIALNLGRLLLKVEELTTVNEALKKQIADAAEQQKADEPKTD